MTDGNYLRVRGEYASSTCMMSMMVELPPRARRILKDCDDLGVRHGTTSACAENTCFYYSWGGCGWNYLRVRGEYDCTLKLINIRAELPPRARRIPETRVFPAYNYGTTSACAENTIRWVWSE